MYKIEIYSDKYGVSEIEEYIKELKNSDNKSNNIKFTKIISYIRMLKEMGIELREPYIKHIDSELWELRPLKDRILFAYYKNNTFILLSVFTKKTKKTPKREIEKAKRLYKDYRMRKGEI